MSSLSLLAWLAAVSDAAVVARSPAGSLELEVDGHAVVVPTLKSDFDARIDGDMATVRLVQTFRNPAEVPVHAKYVFPLPTDAAVFDMVMTTPTAVVRADIARREEAHAKFEAAKHEGHKAALLDQERPNVFVQQVANLGPGEEVKIELSYAHAVERIDGVWTFTLPMVVGPRYVPPDSAASPSLPEGQWTVQSTDTLPLPEHIDPGRVSVDIRLDAGLPLIGAVASASHPLSVRPGAPGAAEVKLAQGRVLDNRDLVVTWQTAGEKTAVGTAASATGGHGVVELLVEPPAAPAAASLTPRELVFVLDTSCSMGGFPLETSKRLMKQALVGLHPTDRFRLVRFSTGASEMDARPLPADGETIARALLWIDALGADGGTETRRGLERAFRPPVPDGAVRLVTLLTDGYVGDEVEVAQLIEAERGQARVFSLGIGSSVNRFLVEEVARAGRGVSRVVLSPDDAEEAAGDLLAHLDAPVLTDVAIDWGEAPVRQATPARLPDLIAGQPLRVLARYDAAGTWPIRITGRLRGEPAVLPVQLVLPKEAAGREALGIAWARAQIGDRMIDRLDPRRTAEEQAKLQEEVTVLGLEYRLVTPWTSFVAVDERSLAPSGASVDAAVATPPPAGVGPQAFGGHGGGFGGSSAPEPAAWLAGLLVFGLGGLATRQKR